VERKKRSHEGEKKRIAGGKRFDLGGTGNTVGPLEEKSDFPQRERRILEQREKKV